MSSAPGLTVLVDNNASTAGSIAEHGLSYWIECADTRILFDTGQGAALLPNAERLHIPLDTADALVLSHGHYDHTGGLADVLRLGGGPTLYAHPDAFAPRYVRRATGVAEEIGIRDITEAEVRACAQIVWTNGPTEIGPGVYATGPIPRRNDYEDSGGAFFADPACTVPDPFRDDQALYVTTSDGVAVILGCAHAGVINTLEYIKALTSGRPIRLVIGGMHLGKASPERMERTIEALRPLAIPRLIPAHCTGFNAAAQLRQAFGDACQPATVGLRIELDG